MALTYKDFEHERLRRQHARAEGTTSFVEPASPQVWKLTDYADVPDSIPDGSVLVYDGDESDWVARFTLQLSTAVAGENAGFFQNTEDWYGTWWTIGNAPGSVGFPGTPTAAPATTVGTGGVTLPLTNGIFPVADCGQLSVNGGSFAIGGNIVTYSSRSTASGAGNATGCYTAASASGTFSAGTALSFIPLGFFPLVVSHKFGDTTGGSNRPIPGSTQAGGMLAAYYGPTVNDSMEGFSVFVAAKDTGTPYVQHRPITAIEAIAQVEGSNTLPDGITTPLLGIGSRTMVVGDSHVNVAVGFKLSHNSAGSDFGFTDNYYGFYQPTSALVTYTTTNGSTAPSATTMNVVSGAAMPPASVAYPVTVTVSANADGVGGFPITYTGISSNQMTGVTGVASTIATGATVQSNAFSLLAKDRIGVKAGLVMGDSAFSGSTVLALRGGSDADRAVLSLTAANNADIAGGQTLIRLNAGTSQTQQVFKMYDSSNTNRLSITAAGALIINGQSFQAQTSGTLNALMGIDGYVQVGTSVSRGGVNGLGAKINSGSGAPAYSAALGDIFTRIDTPTTANQRIYICTTASSASTGAWTGIV